MKKILVICSVLILSYTAVFAFQNEGKRDGKRKGMPVVVMVKMLDLTEDQETKFRVVMKEEREKRQAIKEAARIEMEKVREQMKGVSDETIARLSTVLDDTQLEDFKELRPEIKKKEHHHQVK